MTPASTTRPADGYAFESPMYAWSLVAILSGLGIASFMDRQLLTLLVEPLRRDFGVTDVQFSLLQGFAFSLFYALAALPIGKAADRWPRKTIIIVGATLWSAATLLCMVVKSYAMLFVARMVVGLGEAVLIPGAISMLGDVFPKKRLSGAVSVLAASSFLGSGATFALGGLVVVRLPKTMVMLPLVGATHGWQLAFGIACIPGLVLIGALFGMPEPPRRSDATMSAGEASLADVARFLAQKPVFWLSLVFGMTLLSANQYGLTGWAVAFFIRTYGWNAAQIGVILGSYFIVLGPLASLTGGFLCDRVVARRGPEAMLSVPLWAALLALPLAEIFALNGSAGVSASVLGVLTFIGIVPLGPGLASIPLMAPNRMRAQLTAVYLLIINLVGGGGGPWLVAAVTQYIFHDPAALKLSIALVDGVLLTAAVVALGIGLRRSKA